jgi:hypothetical protein
MLRAAPVFSAIFFAVMGAALVRAQAKAPAFSIPAWIDRGKCTEAPTFGPTLNGKPATVEKQLAPGSDQVILIVLDLTGDLSRIDEAKRAVASSISKLPRNVWVGLLRAQDGLHVLTDPTANRQAVTDTIQSVTSSGTPGLLETLRATLSLADAIIRKSPVRVSVLYITDGSIYNYREDYTDPVINPSDKHDLSRRFRDVLINEKISKLERRISSLEAPLFVVHLQYRQSQLDLAYQNGLDALAKGTGGETVICRSTSEIPQAISHIFARISDVWGLVLSVPRKSHRELQVGLKASCDGQDVQISWRPYFRPQEE